MRVAETTGKTVDEAVDKALAQLGLRRDQVDVDVVTEGKAGIFGLGSEPAMVRVTALDEAAVAPDRDVSRETRESEGGADAADGEDGGRPRRRRGRRGGRRRRRGGEDAPESRGETATAEAPPRDDSADDSDAGGGKETGSDRGGRGERSERGGRRGGRSRSGSRNGGPRGRGRSERPDSRPSEPIEGVSDEEAIPVPGTPEELPYQPIEDPADDVDLAGATLRDVLTLLGYMNTEITARDPETPGDGVGLIEQIFDIYGENDDESDELGVLIGRRGETLGALQYLVNTIVSKGGNKPPVFGVDIEGYRRRREEMLVDLARDIAAEVRETGDVITLEPMPAHERRIVHIALREEDGVRTESVGSGEHRQVEILPE